MGDERMKPTEYCFDYCENYKQDECELTDTTILYKCEDYGFFTACSDFDCSEAPFEINKVN